MYIHVKIAMHKRKSMLNFASIPHSLYLQKPVLYESKAKLHVKHHLPNSNYNHNNWNKKTLFTKYQHISEAFLCVNI